MSHGRRKRHERFFDFTAGSYDGAELWKLIGMYIQYVLESTYPKHQMMNQDDGLIVPHKIDNEQADKIRKNIVSICKSINLTFKHLPLVVRVVKGLLKTLQVLKYFNNQNQIMTKHWKNLGIKHPCNTHSKIWDNIAPEKEDENHLVHSLYVKTNVGKIFYQ